MNNEEIRLFTELNIRDLEIFIGVSQHEGNDTFTIGKSLTIQQARELMMELSYKLKELNKAKEMRD